MKWVMLNVIPHELGAEQRSREGKKKKVKNGRNAPRKVEKQRKAEVKELKERNSRGMEQNWGRKTPFWLNPPRDIDGLGSHWDVGRGLSVCPPVPQRPQSPKNHP